MLIHINRKIFKSLSEDLRETYVRESIPFEIEERIGDSYDINNIVSGIIHLIIQNENIIDKYGWDEYCNETYPAFDNCSGYYQASGKYGVSFFDISAETEDDLSYSFNVFEVI